MRITLIAVAVITGFLGLGLPARTEEKKPDTSLAVVTACLHQGSVYVVTGRHDDHRVRYYLQRGNLSESGKKATIEELVIRSAWRFPIFHIWNDTFFGASGRLHPDEPLMATRLSNIEQDPDPMPNPFVEHKDRHTLLSFSPLANIAWRNAPSNGIAFNTRRIDDARQGFAISPDGKLSAFLVWKGRIKLWTAKLPHIPRIPTLDLAKMTWDRWIGPEEMVPTPLPALDVETEIKDLFVAYQSAGDYFFVTETGEVHSLPCTGEPERTNVLWKDKDRAVRFLLKDNATGTTWAFAPCKDPRAKDVAAVYFALGKAISPIKYEASALPTFDRAKPLSTALTYARFLTKEKKIGSLSSEKTTDK